MVESADMRAVVRAGRGSRRGRDGANTGGGARLARVALRAPQAGWVRARVLLAGICRTDLYAARGEIAVDEGRVLGHELVGEVEGDRVTVSPLVPCGACGGCARGRCGAPRMIGVAIDGAFAEHVVVPAAAVHRVPRELPLRRAAYVEPIAASLAVLRAPIRPSERGLVVGEGRIAALTERILRAHGFERVARSGSADGEPFDFAIETSADRLDEALRAVRPGGVVVLKSRPARAVPLDLARAVLNDVTLASVSYAPFDEAIALAATLPIDDLLGDAFPLERFETAFARASEPGAPKIFLSPGGA